MTNTDTSDAIGTAIQVKELARAGSELVRITVETDQQSRSIAGTLFAGQKPRLVEIKGIPVEADFARHMLYVTNKDKPGFIGRFGAN